MANKKALELLKREDIDAFNTWVKERRKKGKDSVDLDDQNLGGLKLRATRQRRKPLEHGGACRRCRST